MAIGTDDAVGKFGSQTAVTTTGASTADGVFTSAGTYTNTDDAPSAVAVLTVNYSVAPDANSVVNLYGQLMNIQGTKDQPVPTANFAHTYLGSFPVKDIITEFPVGIPITLLSEDTQQITTFFIENKSGQTIPVNWSLHIRANTIGPKPA